MLKIYAFLLTIFMLLTIPFTRNVNAQDEKQKLEELTRQIEEYQRQVDGLSKKANTLANEIARFDTQIHLTELKIAQTQEQILLLGGRIDQLEGSLSSLSQAFSSRVIETYKMSRVREDVIVLITAPDLPKAVAQLYYLRKIQEADRDLMVRLQKTQNTYKTQKGQQEELQQQLQDQKNDLDSQKKAKANLLSVTKNNEKKYQELLSAARAEYEAIQAILAGHGEESAAGHVNEGQRIASIIQGPSCNSGGTHTHFMVSQGGNTQNPFSFLKSGVDFENCSGSSCGSSDGDQFNPSGSWDWPIQPKIRFNQGYGTTWAVKNGLVHGIYNFHNGIDINSYASSEVKAVKSGNLFRGSYSGIAGCRLRYVRIHHDEGGLDTFYLHIDY